MLEKHSTKKQIRYELQEERSKIEETALRLSMLRSLYPRLFQDSAVLGIIKLNVKGLDTIKPSNACLKQTYQLIAHGLSLSLAEVTRQTIAEITLASKMQKFSGCKYIQSMWIGRKNIDLFIPTITGNQSGRKRFCGVAIEIDGTVHELYTKNLKDNDKEELLHWIGIITIRFKNADLMSQANLQSLKTAHYFQPADSRAKRRMWLKIYLVTIFLNASEHELENIFKIDLKTFRKKFQRALTGKSL